MIAPALPMIKDVSQNSDLKRPFSSLQFYPELNKVHESRPTMKRKKLDYSSDQNQDSDDRDGESEKDDLENDVPDAEMTNTDNQTSLPSRIKRMYLNLQDTIPRSLNPD